MARSLFVICLFCLTAAQDLVARQICNDTVLASKAFPTAANTVIWRSNRPVEYLFPGEKVHVHVTGQMNYRPERKSDDKGGVLGFFKKHVEWIEDHWTYPDKRKPEFPNAQVVAGSEKMNADSTYDCDLLIDANGVDITKGLILEVKVLENHELSGTGGLTTGEYQFRLVIDNAARLALIKNAITTNMNAWSASAVEKLKALIETDQRIKCNYFDELAETIMRSAAGLSKNIKQEVLKYASELSPGNHEITIELATTYSGQPGGCDKQISLLANNGITSIVIDPENFKPLDNSARAFDLLAKAYFSCNENFRDNASLDTVRNYYRMAANQYGMVYNYPKQIEMGILYANLELDNNDKQQIVHAARFLEDMRLNVPASIDSVGEEERKAFFGKFGNTFHKFYRDVQDSIVFQMRQKNNPWKDLFRDTVKVVMRKEPDSFIRVVYKYADYYLCPQKFTNKMLTLKTVWTIQALLDKKSVVRSYKVSKVVDTAKNTLSRNEDASILSEDSIRKILPVAINSFIGFLNLPQYCPKATIDGRHVTHDLGNFQVYYYTNEQGYSVKTENSLPFLALTKSSCLLTQQRGNAQNTRDNLILNTQMSPMLVDGSGFIWEVTNVQYH